MNNWQSTVEEAIELIGRVPGFEGEATRLATLSREGRIRFAPEMDDRGRASLSGIITLGPEAFLGSRLGLAETLAHEAFHLRQNPFYKTASFWAGVATRTPVMRRYERPAYAYAFRFLRAAEIALPEWAETARQEQAELLASFRYHYRASLSEDPTSDDVL